MGPAKPPVVPIAVIKPMPAPTAGPDRNDETALTCGASDAKIPAAAKESAISDSVVDVERLATTKPADATKAGIAMCQMRSSRRSLERPHRIITTTAAE